MGVIAFTTTARSQSSPTPLFPTPNANTAFGTAVAAADRYILVGAPRDSRKGANAGAVYVFDATTRALVRTLYNFDAKANDRFGSSLAVAGGILVVGSPGRDSGQGMITWFSFPAGVPLGIFPGFYVEGGSMGAAVSISGPLIAIGQPDFRVRHTPPGGSAQNLAQAGRFIRLDLRNLSDVRFFTASQPQAGARLSASLASEGNLVLVGAPGTNNSSGAGLLYDYSDLSRTTEVALLESPNPAPGELFGARVAMEAGIAAIAAPEAASSVGRVEIWDLRLTARIDTLTPPTPTGSDRFGSSLALENARLLVGAPGRTHPTAGTNAGALFYYPTLSPVPAPTQITAATPAPDASFGASAALAGPLLATGAPTEVSSALPRGAVHILADLPTAAIDFQPVLAKAAPAPGLPNAFLNRPTQTLFSTTGTPLAIATTTSPKGKGLWRFPASSTLLQATGQTYISAPATISDLITASSNSPRFDLSLVKGAGRGITTARDIALFLHAPAGSSVLLQEGQSLPSLPGPVIQTLTEFTQDAQHVQTLVKLTPSRSLPVSSANDSVLWIHRPGLLDWTESSSLLREGLSTTTETTPQTLGEILPGTAISGSTETTPGTTAFIAGLIGPTTTNHAVFHTPTGTLSAPVAQRGQPAPGFVSSPFQTFTGIATNGTHYVFRATVRTGNGVSTATNEGLFTNRNGGAQHLILRKGVSNPGLPQGVTVRRILNFGISTSGQILARCVVGGPRISSSNDTVILVAELDGTLNVLGAEGVPIPGVTGGAVGVIQKADFSADGTFQLLCSVSRCAASANQILLEGNATPAPFTGLRRPLTVIRKGDILPGGTGKKVTGIFVTSATRKNGVWGSGLPAGLHPGPQGTLSLFTLLFADKTEVLYVNGSE